MKYEQLDIFGAHITDVVKQPERPTCHTPLDDTCPVRHHVEGFTCSLTQGHPGRHMYIEAFPRGRTYRHLLWDRGPYEEER